ncbi:helix-turn-helix domain-containing protein [Parachitinimonas caeni]|uniref:Helix-turn-helix domain-containing protein n=1 Tax=Parachitinimonas caeni TaxID=3031301 RepID=A0ABT7E3B1_9NEIS|nr:helix-turn-helix domain-containing protein [Parachitinimonas caeni]MDK2126806.1 helix-turn-helix domain-containing protein [Parachitinimonas caeni]
MPFQGGVAGKSIEVFQNDGDWSKVLSLLKFCCNNLYESNAWLCASEILKSFPIRNWPKVGMDSRIVEVLEKINICGVSDISSLRRNTNLSSSRFAHLFTEQTGVSLKRYLLWRRSVKAANYLASGHSATFAAHSCGFSDSSHMSRNFADILGISPSFLQRAEVTLCKLPV